MKKPAHWLLAFTFSALCLGHSSDGANADVGVASAEPARNAVYLEVGGTAVVYSLNYERMVANGFALRLGLSRWAVFGSEYVLVPLGVSYLFGQSAHKMELGGTVTTAFDPCDINCEATVQPYLAGNLGYRYQPPTAGFFFRVAFTPLFMKAFYPWFGVALGGVF